MHAHPPETLTPPVRAPDASFAQQLSDLAQRKAIEPSGCRPPRPSDRSPGLRPCVALTVDVEEWFHAHALRVPSDHWDNLPSRLDAPIAVLLDGLETYDARATFFVLGRVAKSRPDIVRRIAGAGHEIASHGFHHRRADEMTIDAFREDATSSRCLLEAISERRVLGYRAPSYSLTAHAHAHFETLADAGFTYDSSVYPARAWHGGYGDAAASVRPHFIHAGLFEFPLPTLRIGRLRIPAASGAYLRLMPYTVTRRAIRQNLRSGIPVVINVHPWELDPGQPRIKTSAVTKLRHYTGLKRTARKLRNILREFGSVALEELIPLEISRACP